MITNRRSDVDDAANLPVGQTRACPVCGAPAAFAYRSTEADLYRCGTCQHCFADQQSIHQFVGYDSDYGDQDHKNWFDNPNLRLFRFVAGSLGQAAGTSVLDVGCGRGAFLSYLHELRPTWKLTGIEVSPFEPPTGVGLVVGNFEDTDFGHQFDAVVSLAVIEHVIDPHKFVTKVVECCRPGGTIVLMTLNEQSTLYDTSRLLRRAGITGPFEQLYSTHHLHHFTKASLARLLERHGLKIHARFDGHIPAAAIDFPERGLVADTVQRVGAMGTFALGRLLRRCYLQTVVCRAPDT